VQPVEVLGHQTGLVALHRANAVPLQSGRTKLAQCRHLFDRLLKVVFAKRRLARVRCIEHGLGPKRFGNS